MLGAGIYALVGEAAGKAGDALWVSFLIAAAIAAVIGLSSAELASAFPKAGADYEYTRQALGQRAAFVVGWPSVIGNLVAAAAVALGLGAYVSELVGGNRTALAVAALVVALPVGLYNAGLSMSTKRQRGPRRTLVVLSHGDDYQRRWLVTGRLLKQSLQ